MTSTLEDRFNQLLSPYFRYANEQNPSHVESTWKDSDQTTRVRRVYANCVACNAPRFKLDQLSSTLKGTNCFFCDSCDKTIIETFDGYHDISPIVFRKVWNNLLFPQLNNKPSS